MYNFRWQNNDGNTHNLELRDEHGNVVDGYQSASASSMDTEVELTDVLAVDYIAHYACRYHRSTQIGDITIYHD